MEDICGCELPTNMQNFTQNDLTEVKLFQNVLGGLLFFETPGRYNQMTQERVF